MRPPKVYFSIPISFEWGKVVSIYQKYCKTHLISFWKRGETYYPELLRDSDALVMFTLENTWKTSLTQMPIGCRREFLAALSMNKPVFLANYFI